MRVCLQIPRFKSADYVFAESILDVFREIADEVATQLV